MTKPVLTWEEFQAEATAAMWSRIRLEHRVQGCKECAAGGCVNGEER